MRTNRFTFKFTDYLGNSHTKDFQAESIGQAWMLATHYVLTVINPAIDIIQLMEYTQ